ncbi:MAG: SCO family protein [Alphaproteobacteria bacterium]
MLAALGAIGLAAFIAWVRLADSGPVARSGSVTTLTVASSVQIGGPYALVDHRGQTVRSSDFQGKFQLIYFGYAYCPDVCPTELAAMAQALDDLGGKAERVQPLFITVDPERDTPEFLAGYVPHFHPRLIGLTGTQEQIAAVAKSFREYYAKVESDRQTDYLMDHTSFIYLMGPDGNFLTMFRYGMQPAAMAEAIAAFIDKAG